MSDSRRAHHIVRFSAHDDDLVPAIADFVSDGVRLGERVVLLIRPRLWNSVEQQLLSNRIRIGTALKHREVVVVNAEETLERVTGADGRVDVDAFAGILSAICDPLARPMRAYGEMVTLLANRGQLDAAIEIERLGHALAQDGVNILCAYHVGHLKASDYVERICAEHHAAVAGGGEPKGLAPIVLLADDFHDGRELYEEYLRFKGYQVVSAHDGLQAISLAHIARPAVMLLDVRMPRMSGLEAMQILKKEPAFRHTPIVALTAHALDDEREIFMSSGFDAVLAKPCLPADVARTVEQLLG